MVERMELDDTGFPQPTGELEELDADTLVLALGQDTDLSLLGGIGGIEVDDGVVRVDAQMMTGVPGIFAGGDMVSAERTVTVAIGHGSRAAASIDAWLRPADASAEAEPPLASFDALNPWYYADAPKTVRPELDAVRRQSTFDEVVQGLSADNALFEARRCLSCGSCFACDNCYGRVPRQRGDQARARRRLGLRDRSGLLQGLRPVRPGVPLRCDRDGRRADLGDGPRGRARVQGERRVLVGDERRHGTTSASAAGTGSAAARLAPQRRARSSSPSTRGPSLAATRKLDVSSTV